MAPMASSTSMATLEPFCPRLPPPLGPRMPGGFGQQRRGTGHRTRLVGLHRPRRSLRVQLAEPRWANRPPHHSESDTRDAFVRWLKDLGVDFCNLKLERVGGDDGARFGTVAGAGGIRQGSVVVQVPRKAFMNVETAHQCPLIGSLIKSSELNEWQMLCLHLLTQVRLGENSYWYAYLRILPSKEEMENLHPMLWDENFRSKSLQGSPLLQKINSRLDQCRQDYEKISSVLKQKRNNLNEPVAEFLQAFTTQDIIWSSCILLSRAFYLEISQDSDITELPSNSNYELELEFDVRPLLTLVPWADMLNHSSECTSESCLIFDPESECATLQAHKPYSENEQVFDTYGTRLSKWQLFLDYGFIDSSNQIDSIEIPANEVFEVKNEPNLSLLNAIGLPPDEAAFVFSNDGVDETMLSWSRAAMASEDELKLSGWLSSKSLSDNKKKKKKATVVEDLEIKAASSMSYFFKPISKENETRMLTKLVEAIDIQLERYEKNNANICDDSGEFDANNWKRIQSSRIIESEIKALNQTKKLLEEMLLSVQA